MSDGGLTGAHREPWGRQRIRPTGAHRAPALSLRFSPLSSVARGSVSTPRLLGFTAELSPRPEVCGAVGLRVPAPFVYSLRYSPLSALFQPFFALHGGCSALRPAPHSGVVLPSGISAPRRYATPRMASLRSDMRGYATLSGGAHASRMQHRPRCGPHGLKACAPAARACAASFACTGVAARLCS